MLFISIQNRKQNGAIRSSSETMHEELQEIHETKTENGYLRQGVQYAVLRDLHYHDRQGRQIREPAVVLFQLMFFCLVSA